MLHNYHTHTARCGHAKGTEREYIETAIKKGFQTLGFSDHAPYIEPLANRKGHRIPSELAEDYATSVRALQKEYEKDIRILCGFELEYYPDFHAAEMEYLKTFSPDYLILGQHFLSEPLNIPSYAGEDETRLNEYVTRVINGMATGDFLYLAHPDLAGFECSNEAWNREYRRLCIGAKELGVPLEINLLGLRTGRRYPDERFFKIAAEVGNGIVLGVDAHSPESFLDEEQYKKAKEMVEKFGLKLLEKLL